MKNASLALEVLGWLEADDGWTLETAWCGEVKLLTQIKLAFFHSTIWT